VIENRKIWSIKHPIEEYKHLAKVEFSEKLCKDHPGCLMLKNLKYLDINQQRILTYYLAKSLKDLNHSNIDLSPEVLEYCNFCANVINLYHRRKLTKKQINDYFEESYYSLSSAEVSHFPKVAPRFRVFTQTYFSSYRPFLFSMVPNNIYNYGFKLNPQLFCDLVNNGVTMKEVRDLVPYEEEFDTLMHFIREKN
jgi:hypothetical protein